MVERRAEARRQRFYMCLRGSPGLNFLSGRNAFPMTVVRTHSVKRLKRIFEEIDSDKDGLISFTEFKAHMRKASPLLSRMAQGLFTTMDTSGSGQLSFKTLLKKLYPSVTREQLAKLLHMGGGKGPARIRLQNKHLDQIKAMWMVYDTDNSGQLIFSEFVAGLQNAGFTEEDAEDMFRQVDSDGSGLIRFEEFITWYQKEILQVSEAAGKNVVDSSSSDSDSSSDDEYGFGADIDPGDPMGGTETDELMRGFDKLRMGQPKKLHPMSMSSEIMRVLREAPPEPGFRTEGSAGGLQRYASLAAGI